MAEVNEQRRTLYLDPRLGWTEQETPDAQLKLASIWRMPEVRAVVENQLYQRFDRGGWTDVSADTMAQLSGSEKGLVFMSKPRIGDSGHFMEITATRFVDKTMKPILEGIPLLDSDLRPIGPQMAAGLFCIPASHMPAFMQRVQEMGGVVREGQAQLQVLHSKLNRLGSIASELEAMCAQSRAVIDQVAGGMTTEVPSIGERCTRAHALYVEASRLAREIEEGQLAAQQHPGQIEARAHAEAYAEHAQQWVAHIERLHREHVSYEAQARLRTKQSISQTLPGVEAAASTARYLMQDVVEFYVEQGYDARLTNDGMILVLGDTIVELGDKPSVRHSGGETTADHILGRTTAERAQREL